MKILFGYDTETFKGPPISQQIWNPDYNEMRWIDEKTCFKNFLEFLDELPNNGTDYIFWALNLEFDMRSLFYDRLEELDRESFHFTEREYTVSGIYAGVSFAKFTHVSKRKTVWLVDISAFFSGSLDSLAAIHCPGVRKLVRPEGLGDKRFTAKDTAFVDYSMRDAEICYHIGRNIEALHEKYQLGQCVSAPQFAGKVFTTHYLKEKIPNPPAAVTGAAWQTYHGGKNGFYTKPGFHRDVVGLDLVSAYTWAMSRLPGFCDTRRYCKLSGSAHSKTVPEFGVYRISGKAKDCKYPILYKREKSTSKKWVPVSGLISNLWFTGAEINEALEADELKIDRIFGHYYDTDSLEVSPFSRFALDFFDKKDTAENEIDRTFYKLMTNALYGKLCETRKQRSYYDMAEEKLHTNDSVQPGPLFFPMASTSITGMIRAKIHALEHKYHAIHTSTDGILCPAEYVDKTKLKAGLGGLKVECEGDALLFRNKVYIVYSDIPGKKAVKSTIFPGKYVVKYAHHAFHGSLEQLEKMYANPDNLPEKTRWKYTHTHVNKVKESIKSRSSKSGKPVKIVNNFEMRESSLKGITFDEN